MPPIRDHQPIKISCNNKASVNKISNFFGQETFTDCFDHSVNVRVNCVTTRPCEGGEEIGQAGAPRAVCHCVSLPVQSGIEFPRSTLRLHELPEEAEVD